ncbi:uncharacterized protein [Mytilus edulis]|uniref:uncharacterized protein n=1 Tax=Mytilus edulis TaxID=6550 RepID=UPI0039F0A813
MGKKYCCVPLCHNTSDTVTENGSKVILHRFPMSEKKSHIKRQWITRVNNVRANFVVNDSSRICSEHFEGPFTDQSLPTRFPSKPQKEVKTRRPLLKYELNVDNNINIPPCDTQMSHINDTSILEGLNENVHAMHNFEKLAIATQTMDTGMNATPEYVDVETQVGHTKEVKDIGIQCDLPRMIFEDIKDDDSKVKFYTGFPTFKVFWLFFLTLTKHGAEKLNYWEGEKRSMGDKLYHQESYDKPGKKTFLRPIDEFLLTCMKLRLGLNQEHLADIFRISKTTVSRTFNTWVNFIYDHSKGLIAWPTREQILANLPQHFNDHVNTRIVLDCTEFFTERPSSLVSQWLTWSEYKHHNTFKVLIGVTPNGMVTFVSRLWGGNVSDRHIVEHDGLIPKLSPGDVIMADKGFTIEDLLSPDIGLNVPPRVSTKHQMSSSEFFKTANIASARIVVEMKMEQVKNFQILNSILPLSEAHLAEQIAIICISWTNLLPPLLQ